MKRGVVLFAVVTVLAFPVLAKEKMTVEQYREELSNAMQREKDAKEALAQEQVRLEDLQQQVSDTQSRIVTATQELYSMAGTTEADLTSFEQRLGENKSELNSVFGMPGNELLQNRARFEGKKKQYAGLKRENSAKLPRFRSSLQEANDLIAQIEQRFVQETEAAKQAAADSIGAAKAQAIADKQTAKERAKAAKEQARLDRQTAAEQARADREAAKTAKPAARANRQSEAGTVVHSVDQSGAESYTVESYGKSGDCLWNIAKRLYGDEAKWETIFDANRDVVKDPDVIQAGTTLRIPR